MRRHAALLMALVAGLSCTPDGPLPLSVETEFAFLNLSRRWYAAVSVRPSAAPNEAPAVFPPGKLIPPGAVWRERFPNVFEMPQGCPARLDLRIHLYKRINETIPVSRDDGEALGPQAVASAEINGIVACEKVIASSFSIALRDSQEGVGVLKIAQDTAAQADMQFAGVNLPELDALPATLSVVSLEGHVLSPNGDPVGGVGVLLRARYRVGDDDTAICPDEPAGLCFTHPIAIATTDETGWFAFDRPPGAYRIDVFADGLLFRPASILVESPIDDVLFLAEPEP